ncbi:uncharacterized protein SPPG_09348 [Spizellomyces punctatus DAOM BR117]|uniref:Uncharacterized protein n=1 Tax=Spizellomyces punctatus (strain DAOM BR117) TaxID=645134 RepID=A0A0L0HB42_SPIPD|nr:uncharacterized protein SPPG_09348 [Spizellomyces punctatus DAOM BR117]KNC98437.1 hypothetical protein SPPG_09348 [Spizellomyces punctatus DAOM BR117]|eukprot:XP_016606477.1 hypothetical protein SPPG_09348 [Spizellomyces punctatus DAOM BR117]
MSVTLADLAENVNVLTANSTSSHSSSISASSNTVSWETFLQQYARGLFPPTKVPKKPRNAPPFETAFLPAPTPPPEIESLRRKALYKYRWLLNEKPEGVDSVVELTRKHFAAEHAILSFVLEDEAMFRLENTDFCTSDRSISICSHSVLRHGKEGMVILDTHKDWRFQQNPNVLNAPFVRFYASAHLITADGFNIGSLCVIDSTSRDAFSDQEMEELQRFANLVMSQLDVWVYKKEVEERDRREEALAEYAQASLVGHEPNLQDAYQLACSLIARSLDVEYVCILEPEEIENHLGGYGPLTSTDRRVVGSNEPSLLNKVASMNCSGTYDLVTATSMSISGTEFQFPPEIPAAVPSFMNGLDVVSSIAVPLRRGGDSEHNGILAAFSKDRRRLFGASQMHFLNTFAVNITALLLKVKAEAATRAKLAFLSSISHELLRTPLHGLLGVSELLSSTPLNGSQEAFVSTIESCGKSLLGIVNNVLDVAKRTEGRKASHVEDVDLYSLLQEVMDAVTATVNPNVELLLDINLPPRLQFLQTDPNSVRQILMNLVGNALKFTEKGYVEVKVSLLDSAISNASEVPLRFEVSDTGCGISPAFLPKLFKPFSQENPLKQGAGLGLLLTRFMVESIGGTLSVASEFGRGTRFYFDVTATVRDPIQSEGASIVSSAVEEMQNKLCRVDVGHLRLANIISKTLSLWGVNNDRGDHLTANETQKVYIVDEPSRTLDRLLSKEELGGPTEITPVLYVTSIAEHPEAARSIRSRLLNPNTRVAIITKPVGPIKLLQAIGKILKSQTRKPRMSIITYSPLKLRYSMESLIPTTTTEEEAADVDIRSIMPVAGRDQEGQLSTDTAHPVPLRCLVAEDNAINRMLISQFLHKMGIECTIAHDGKQAVSVFAEACKANSTGYPTPEGPSTPKPNPFDFVLMDIMMPNMDGNEATRNIRQLENDQNFARSVIIALTGLSSHEDRGAAFEVGVDTFLTKPVGMKVLKATLEKYFEGRVGWAG